MLLPVLTFFECLAVSVVEINQVSKIYPRRRGKRILLGRGGLGDWLRGRDSAPLRILHDINLRVEAGETLGIIGRNGSGKSTLLKIMAGVTLPSSGAAIIRGRVTSLLELGAGFHPMLTGRENIYLNAGLLGIRKASTDELLPHILEFSGIAPFIDQPVETYSSGMYVRLGFSVAAFSNADVYLVDEVLAVGDEDFQRKCRRKIAELKEQGKTIIFVSHDLGTVNALCDRVVLLHEGQLLSRGGSQSTIDFYLRQVGNEAGVHTLRAGKTEAVFNNGRISLFYNEKEVTAASGLDVVVETQGAYHSIISGDWRCTRTTATGCQAEAALARLPVRFNYTLELTEDTLDWRISMDCSAPLQVDSIFLRLPFPAAYREWVHGDRREHFTPITPEDVRYVNLLTPDASPVLGAFVPAPEDGLPVLRFKFSLPPSWTVQYDNSDYVTGARMVLVRRVFPAGGGPLPAGTHELAGVAIALDATEAPLNEQIARDHARRTLTADGFAARMGRGAVECFHHGTLLTRDVHLHTQFHIAHHWHMSQALRWGVPRREGDAVLATGASARFPLRQHWRLSIEGATVRFDVHLEALEALDIMEYNVSLGLPTAYQAWRTPHEAGEFPSIPETQQEWMHVNRSYEPARFVEASGPERPTIRLEIPPDQPPRSMTIITSGFAQQVRVVQAMFLPEKSVALHFEAGTHHVASVLLAVKESE